MTKQRGLTPIWLLLLVAATCLAVDTPADSESCTYVVKKGDNLSRILLRLGVLPLYGKQGNVAVIAKSNQPAVRKDGNLIYPKMRLAIPRSMVGRDEVCLDEGVEKDTNRRIALYGEAEAELKKGGQSALCAQIHGLAKTQANKDEKGRMIHFAAVCEYQEGHLEQASRLWDQVLKLNPEPSLAYRAIYNKALVECQTDRPESGYEKLQGISADLWQSQGEVERRTFLDLAIYCAEKAVSPKAKVEILTTVHKTSPVAELKEYAADKLRTEFANPAQCDATSDALPTLSEGDENGRWQTIWRETCHRYGRNSLFTLSIDPSYLSYYGAGIKPSWFGIGATFDSRFALGKWIVGGSADGLLQPFGRSGIDADIREIELDIYGGRTFELSPHWSLDLSLGAGYMTFLTDDRLIGFYDLVLYSLRVGVLQVRPDASWFRAFATFSLTNSDVRAFDTRNGILALAVDGSPTWLAPFFIGARARIGYLNLGANGHSLFHTAARFGVSW